jgi:hypothetical protein
MRGNTHTRSHTKVGAGEVARRSLAEPIGHEICLAPRFVGNLYDVQACKLLVPPIEVIERGGNTTFCTIERLSLEDATVLLQRNMIKPQAIPA